MKNSRKIHLIKNIGDVQWGNKSWKIKIKNEV